MEAPVYSDSEEESDESLCILPEDLEEEVDINIHFHCEHCIKLSKCRERSKPGWCCDIIDCIHGCGIRLHACKLEEHELLCSHIKVPCINASFGCPHFLQRYSISAHLPLCPASVVVCNAEWNRWALGARERERISSSKGTCSLFDVDDLDMAFAVSDQNLVNQMHSYPKYVRKIMCNGITKRFPILPLTIRGSYHEDDVLKRRKDRARSNSTTDDDEEGLAPGLSFSVCSELLKGKGRRQGTENGCSKLDDVLDELPNGSKDHLKCKKQSDDISDLCCVHGLLKCLCKFCKDDPDEPDFKYGDVWRENLDLAYPGSMAWKKEHRIEKIRKRGPLGLYCYKRVDESDEEELKEYDQTGADEELSHRKFRLPTPPPVPLTPKSLILEMGIKHYSRHQVKPKAMFTFQCMQEMRRDEFTSHYQNVHSEIQEGLDGWLVQRCPLNIIGCPFSIRRLSPGRENGEVVFCHSLRAFSIKNYFSSFGFNHSRSPSVEKSITAMNQLKINSKVMNPIPEHPIFDPDRQFLASSGHITYLPFEVLQRIARKLDGFSLNNLSLTCHLMREVCYSLLDEKGLIIQEWIRTFEQGKVHWKLGNNRWFFSRSFEHVDHWDMQNDGSISNHLATCLFNNRKVNENKFCYLPKIGEEIKRQFNNIHRNNL